MKHHFWSISSYASLWSQDKYSWGSYTTAIPSEVRILHWRNAIYRYVADVWSAVSAWQPFVACPELQSASIVLGKVAVQSFQVTKVKLLSQILNLYQIPVVTSHCFMYWKMEMEHLPWYMWLWTIWKFELSHIPWWVVTSVYCTRTLVHPQKLTVSETCLSWHNFNGWSVRNASHTFFLEESCLVLVLQRNPLEVSYSSRHLRYAVWPVSNGSVPFARDSGPIVAPDSCVK